MGSYIICNYSGIKFIINQFSFNQVSRLISQAFGITASKILKKSDNISEFWCIVFEKWKIRVYVLIG